MIASRIDFGDDRRIALVSEQEDRLSLIHGDELRIVAQQGDVIDGRFEIRKIGNIKLTIRNRLIFTAFGARSIEPGVFESGLFVAHDQGVVPLFVSGDPAPGVTGAAIATVERRHLSLTTLRFRVNSSGTVVVAAEFAPAEGSTFRGSGWGFLRVGADLGKELILPTPENFPDGAPFSIRSNPQFQWTDEDQLVFEAPRMESALSRALFLWTPHELSVLAREGDPVSPLGSQASSLLESVRTLWAVHRDRVFFRARVRGEDTSGLYAAIPGKAHQYAIPHVVAGDFGQTHYETSLLLQNRDSESARVDVYLLSPEGQVVVAMERFRLEAGEVRTLILDPPEAFVGWARVEVTGGALAVFERFAVKAGEELVSQVTVPAVFQRQTGSWTGSDSFGDTNGGIAIANPYNAPIYVQVEVVIPGLRIERQSTLEIPAKGQRAVLQSELFPSCRCSGRIIRFRTDLPVPAISLRLDGIRIASQPIVH